MQNKDCFTYQRTYYTVVSPAPVFPLTLVVFHAKHTTDAGFPQLRAARGGHWSDREMGKGLPPPPPPTISLSQWGILSKKK